MAAAEDRGRLILYAWSRDEVQIIKAAWSTDAGRLALTVIVEHLAGLQSSTYDDNPGRMAHSEGRRSVGIDLMRAINLPMDKLMETRPDDRHGTLTATERAARYAAGERGR
jgi:hypothetical protein